MSEEISGTFVHQFRLGPWDNFIYLLGDRATRRVAIVDPAWHAPSILDEVARLDLSVAAILCTHSHFDHVNKVEAVLAEVDVPVHMLAAEVEFSGFRCENLVASRPGDEVRIGRDLVITMMHTPGHTPGSCSYRLRDSVVTGDTLFVDGCGRCDFVGGDPEVMYSTLHGILAKLPGDTVLYPGHDYGPTGRATLDDQLESNPWLRQPTLAEFVRHRMSGRTPNTPALVGADDWSPDSA